MSVCQLIKKVSKVSLVVSYLSPSRIKAQSLLISFSRCFLFLIALPLEPCAVGVPGEANESPCRRAMFAMSADPAIHDDQQDAVDVVDAVGDYVRLVRTAFLSPSLP